MESMTFVLFGATGNLAKRKIFPALYNLYIDKKLPQPVSIIGLGRGELSHDDFQRAAWSMMLPKWGNLLRLFAIAGWTQTK